MNVDAEQLIAAIRRRHAQQLEQLSFEAAVLETQLEEARRQLAQLTAQREAEGAGQ